MSLSQFTMLSSSPLKPSTFYFQDQDGKTALLQDDKFKPTALNFNPDLGEANSSHMDSQGDKDDDYLVPAAHPPGHHDVDDSGPFKTNVFLKYPSPVATNIFVSESNQNIGYDITLSQQQHHHHQLYPHQHQDQLQQLQQHQLHQPHNTQHLQIQAQQYQVPPQTNLYPPMEFMPTHNHPSNKHSPRRSGVIESHSSNTIASHDSVPLLGMSSSVSDNSIASPMSIPSHTMATPRRPQNTRRLSAHMTTPSQAFQTPAQNTAIFTSPVTHKNVATPSASVQKNRPRHRRTRSKLSLDASGAASIVTIHASASTSSIRSPAAGTNPFYTPPAFLSPHVQQHSSSFNESPAATPLATPSAMRKFHSFSSISPNMLMNPGSRYESRDSSSNSLHPAAAADLTIEMASKFVNQPDNSQFFSQPLTEYHDSRSITQRPSLSSSSSQPNFSTNSFHDISDHSQYSLHNEHPIMDQIPETVLESSHLSNSSSSTSLSSQSTTKNDSTSRSTINSSGESRTVSLSKPLSRSHSSINLSSMIAPPEIQHYDILQPRKKKLTSSNSLSTIMQTNEELVKMGKQPRKIHSCPLCNAAFQRPEHVKRHLRSHSSEKPFECDEQNCGKRFNRPDNLKAHLRKIHKRSV
jgi:hypothetical protein